MSSFIFSLNSIIPILLVIVFGYILMRVGFFHKEFTQIADKYVFKIALPVLLFRDIATADIHKDFQLKFVLFCMITTTLMFLGIWILARIFLKDRTLTGAFVQGSARGSAAILGIAFIQNIYGSSGMGPLMIVSAVPLYNIFSVVVLYCYSSDRENNKGSIKEALFSIAKNPIILGIFLGLPFAVWGIPIPEIPSKTLSMIAQTASPIALLVVGAGFEGGKALSKINLTVIATTIKLVILPLVFLPFAVWMGFRNEALVAIIIMLGSPTTVTSYVMAKNMGNDEVLTSSIIVLSTLLSAVSLTFWVFLLRINGWI